MYLWPNHFGTTLHPFSTIMELTRLASFTWFPVEHRLAIKRLGYGTAPRFVHYAKRWNFTVNGKFTVKSFYRFISHGGILCETTNLILKGICLKKAYLFNWLVSNNRIFTMDILVDKRCNRLPASTYVYCHVAIESANHLLLLCSMVKCIWHFITQVFCVPAPTQSCKSCGLMAHPAFLLREIFGMLSLGAYHRIYGWNIMNVFFMTNSLHFLWLLPRAFKCFCHWLL